MPDSDKDVLKRRENKLKNEPDLEVEVPLRDRVVNQLVQKLEKLHEGKRTTEIWESGNADRKIWLDRQYKLLQEYDEFIDPIYTATQEWSSTLHLPVAFNVSKTFHGRFLSALLGADPPFTVLARQSANQDRAPLVEGLMRYALKDWANNYKGIEEAVDAWIWSWVTSGVGILKQRWDRRFSRFMDVVEEPRQVGILRTVDPTTGEEVEIPEIRTEEFEKEVTEKVFDGPCIEAVPGEDLLIVGGEGDPDLADEVIQSSFMTQGELLSLADQKVFRIETVKKAIAFGESTKSGTTNGQIKEQQSLNAGESSVDKEFDLERYEILERYGKIDVDGSGIPQDIVLWVHKESNLILRATYLRRINRTGLRPFAKIDFHKRHGQNYGIGIPELTYSLTKELDAIHNIKMDFGLLSSLPLGFYKASSSLSEERIPLEPGTLVPLDNPQTDISFPNMGARSIFAAQEEQFLQAQIERVTSISDLNLGIIAGQGATRTATGTRALLGESNANLDVFLRRLNRGWKRALVFMFTMLQDKIQPGFQFRLLGDDGEQYWETIKSKEEIAGQWDFELDSNSANTNKQIQIQVSNETLQLVSNPLYIQTGIVTPLNIYEAMKSWLQVRGVRDVGRYIQKPQGQQRIFTPMDIANSVLAGVDVQLGPEQDLQGFIDFYQELISTDELLGQFREDQLISLTQKFREATAMQQAVSAQQAQVANDQQVQVNAALGTQPTELGSQLPGPTPGEGAA